MRWPSIFNRRAAAALLAAGAAEGGCQQGNLEAADLVVEVGALGGKQYGLLGGDALRHHARRQIAHVNRVSPHRHHQALNQIFQFAHVARPGVLLEGRQRILGELLDPEPLATQWTARKYSHSREMSPSRSRKGGNWMGTTWTR